MKKFYFIAALAVATLSANAQEKLTLSTYNGTNVAKYDGKVCNVTVNRLMFKGWNTIALPFDVSEAELNETFGSDCKLEMLVGAESNGGNICLNFQDCKAGGIKANVPYILYFTGETANKKLAKEAVVEDAVPALSYAVKGMAETVSMVGVQTKTDGKGLYGVRAIDNSDAKFVQIDETLNGFYATRCYIRLSSGNSLTLTTRHLAAGELTSISAIAKDNELVDVFTTTGVKVASQIPAKEVGNLKANIYIVKGQKIMVK